MDVELLYWDGCPSYAGAHEQLRTLLAELGRDPDSVRLREVSTDADAAREGFVGSPTIRIGGVDVQPPVDQPAALTCRVYRQRDGRISPLPDPDDVREALEAALAGDR